MQIQPYLFFDGRCDEAIEFYRRTLGAEVAMIMRFKDCPDQGMITPGTENKVMHASLHIGDTVVLASDGKCTGQMAFQGFALTISALGDGGQVQMPLGKTFFASSFGMLADRFGMTWMVLVPT
jgi:PhnB protein